MQETQETWVQSLSQENPLEKDTVTHSRNGDPLQYSCLEVPWTREPNGLQCMGLQSLWTILSTQHTRAHTHTHTHTLSALGVFSVPRRRLGAGGSYIASEWILVTRKIKTWLEGRSFQPYLPALKGGERGEVGVNHHRLMASSITAT